MNGNLELKLRLWLTTLNATLFFLFQIVARTTTKNDGVLIYFSNTSHNLYFLFCFRSRLLHEFD